MAIKYYPFYFPQFYEIPENNKWWGEGFTDWVKVKESNPLNENHNQPRIPLNNNYYDQSNPDTQKAQVDLALKYGIDGFNFYHYWFNGKLLLEKPLENFQKLKHDMGYCITWANETWTKRWEGKGNEILIEQKHNRDVKEWEDHFNYLLQFFTDNRYLKIDNKPVFCIYRPDLIPYLNEFISFFQSKSKEHNLEGIYFIALRAYKPKSEKIYKNFDAILRFQPRDVFSAMKKNNFISHLTKFLRFLPEKNQIFLSSIFLRIKENKAIEYDYSSFWDNLLKIALNDHNSNLLKIRIFQSFSVDWDNTPRYKEKAHYFNNSSLQIFKEKVSQLIAIIKSKNEDDIVFINAWNEWSEGAYLEPDTKNEYNYLKILKEVK
jgi:hypothetical protein